jgi:hypothetical protein
LFAKVHVTGREKRKPGKMKATPVMTAFTRLRRSNGVLFVPNSMMNPIYQRSLDSNFFASSSPAFEVISKLTYAELLTRWLALRGCKIWSNRFRLRKDQERYDNYTQY